MARRLAKGHKTHEGSAAHRSARHGARVVAEGLRASLIGGVEAQRAYLCSWYPASAAAPRRAVAVAAAGKEERSEIDLRRRKVTRSGSPMETLVFANGGVLQGQLDGCHTCRVRRLKRMGIVEQDPDNDQDAADDVEDPGDESATGQDGGDAGGGGLVPQPLPPYCSTDTAKRHSRWWVSSRPALALDRPRSLMFRRV